MRTFILRRLLLLIPILLLISVFIFITTSLLPGDAALARLGEERALDDRAYESLRREMGLDRPAPVRYLTWLGNALRGDLGVSLRTNQEVSELIIMRLPLTIQLAATSMAVGLAIAIPTGIIAALRPGTIIDRAATLFALLGIAMPNFWLAVILVYIFSLQLRWLPPSGWAYIHSSPVEGFKLLILPSIVLGTAIAAATMRHLRASLLEALQQAYITTAYSKGLSESRVVYTHAIKNAMIPVVTILGLQVGNLLSGTVIIEVMFGIPGIGRGIVDAILSRDFPVLQATVLFSAIMYILANLITDISYAYLNPRIRYS